MGTTAKFDFYKNGTLLPQHIAFLVIEITKCSRETISSKNLQQCQHQQGVLCLGMLASLLSLKIELPQV
ncbi:hypothetical protein A9255_12410 [Xenorhabdus hominickii]|uniref:Uncharacterized protein n=1 Tax=Xenorhabdus hominickii TaxID=351679 RepID=A0ABM6DT99_XENHO|nr:hypothetical protein A9255_12410 [Xenorhabdus hominickii]